MSNALLPVSAAWAVVMPILQTAEPDAPLPRIVPDGGCAPSASPHEIVVCGRDADVESPYRIPSELRDPQVIEDRNVSWSTRVKDEASVQRYDGQTVGPFGYLKYGRQLDCQWRVYWQMKQGDRPDCTRRVSPLLPPE